MRNYIEDKIKKIVQKLTINPDDYRSYFSNPEKDFTRDRALSLTNVIKIGILKTRKTLNGALRSALGLGQERTSASAFIQQRDKLTQGFYRALFEDIEKDYTPSTS